MQRKMKLLFTVNFIFCVSVQETLSCDFGWHRGGRKCYYFSRFHTNFSSALNFCRYYGGMLVEIDGWHQYNTLVRMSRNRDFSDYWIGLTDMFGEGVWVKATTKRTQSFTRWSGGEPNNAHGIEHCASALHHGLSWNDNPCHASLNFVCEK